MKKLMLSSLIFFNIFLCLSSPIYAANECSWYTKREKDHKTPSLPLEFSYISALGGYANDSFHNSYKMREKVIYLTFDAGYENGNIEKILDILKEEKICAAFFVLGNLIERNTELVCRMADEGHLVCNHTYSHKNMASESKEALFSEIRNLEEVYKSKTGKEMSKFYRPPEGRFSKENLEALNEEGYKTIFWSFAYADWDNKKQPNREEALKKLKENLHNGEIMLLHPTSATNADILSDFITFAKEEGFRFASLEELQ